MWRINRLSNNEMYPSDLTDEQWQRLEPLLAVAGGDRHRGGRPRIYALRRIVDAILYVVRTGCQWRQLPKDFPPWKSVHEAYRAWRREGRWERVGRLLTEQARQAQGRSAQPSAAIIDSQSVKTVQKGGGAAMTQARRSRDASAISQ